MTYKTSRNFDLLAKDPTPEYRHDQRKRAEIIFHSFKQKREWHEDYLVDAKILREALDDYEKIQDWTRGNGTWNDFWVIWTESFYFWLKTALNSEDQESRAKSNQADEFAVKMRNEILFFELSLSRIVAEKQAEFLANPLLEPYHHFLEQQFMASKYLLSSEGEKVLNLLTKTSYENWENMTAKALSQSEKEMDFPTWKKKCTLEELAVLTSDDDESIRKQAINLLNEIHLQTRDMAENEMNSILEYKKTIDDLRGFKTAEDFLKLRDDISVETIHTMVNTVQESFDLSREFYKFKASLLWRESFTYSEKLLKYGSVSQQYSFEEAVELVRQTLKKWDSELLNIFNKSLEDWCIDVFPHKGKHGGAFCTDSSKWSPTYILLNFTNKLRDVSTIIHESWHNASNILMKKNQNALAYGNTLAIAETPSTFYESLLADYLESTLQWEELLIYRMEVLDDMISTVPRQVAEYIYEQDLHKTFREKWYLSADEIGQIFVSHMKDYTWDAITYDEYDANRRISWSHTRSFFYVYSYASGYLVSQALLRKLKNWTLNIDQIKRFFWAGSSMSPENIFLKLWIDITKKEFRNEGLQQMKDYLSETKELARNLWKMK